MGLKMAFLKKYTFPPNVFHISYTRKVEWVACKLFLGKKKYSCIFFYRVSGKKYYDFWNRVSEWLQTFPRKKKYGTFAGTITIKFADL